MTKTNLHSFLRYSVVYDLLVSTVIMIRVEYSCDFLFSWTTLKYFAINTFRSHVHKQLLLP